MNTYKAYENFPIGIVALSNFVSIAIYGLGFWIIHGVGLVFSMLYLAYIVAFEFRLLSRHCVNCYYWGKTCGFGKGRLNSWFFKKGDAQKFCAKEITWKDMVPDMLILVMPLLTGIVLLILHFNIVLLAALLLLVLFSTVGNAYVRGSLTCKHCRQKELGCPADALFNKGKGVA